MDNETRSWIESDGHVLEASLSVFVEDAVRSLEDANSLAMACAFDAERARLERDEARNQAFGYASKYANLKAQMEAPALLIDAPRSKESP